MVEGLLTGWGAVDTAALVLRLCLGSFFIVSGYHKLFVDVRHETLVKTLREDGVYNRLNEWVIPTGEFMGGLALLVGVLTIPASVGLAAICLGAIVYDGLKRIPAMQPLDVADAFDDVEYLPETLYTVMLVALVFTGPGKFSIDHLAWSQLGAYL